MGRPTKYDPSFVAAVDEYLNTTGKEQTTLPKIESFALFIGVHKDTLYEWASKTDDNGNLVYPEFSDALGKILLRQAEQLIDDGIYGGKEVNATIVKLLLMNNHGMRERSDMTSDNKPINTFNDDQVDRIAERVIQRKGSSGNTPSEE